MSLFCCMNHLINFLFSYFIFILNLKAQQLLPVNCLKQKTLIVKVKNI